jgi:hypothetical protein
MAMADENAIELEKLKLERERLDLERQRAAREGSLVNRHLGTIIASLVSIVALLTSFFLGLETSAQKDRELASTLAEADRQWNIHAAEFVAANHASIFSDDDRERLTFQRIIKVVYPQISDSLVAEVENVTSPAILKRALASDPSLTSKLGEWLATKGNVTIHDLLDSRDLSDLRQQAIADFGITSKQITGIPADQIDRVEQSFREVDGATSVIREPQPDGTWTLTVTIPTEKVQ